MKTENEIRIELAEALKRRAYIEGYVGRESKDWRGIINYISALQWVLSENLSGNPNTPVIKNTPLV